MTDMKDDITEVWAESLGLVLMPIPGGRFEVLEGARDLRIGLDGDKVQPFLHGYSLGKSVNAGEREEEAMGDRANVRIVDRWDPERSVYLYTHWGGSDLIHVVKRALSRQLRWDDSHYLARIIFCEMTKGQESGEAGFGISTNLCDNEYPIITIRPAQGTITLEPDPDRDWVKVMPLHCTLGEFVSMTDNAIQLAWSPHYEDD